MSTATITPTSVGQTNTETFDIAYGYQYDLVKGEDGKEVPDPKSREAVVISPESAEKLDAKNQFEGTIVTCRVNYPSTFDSLVTLANTPAVDEEGKPRDQNEIKAEIVKLFVNGAKSKVMNRLRALLTKTDDSGKFTFVEPADKIVDLTDEITSGPKRVFLTEEQKMWKSLDMLPETSKKAVWAAYLTSIGKEYYTPAKQLQV